MEDVWFNRRIETADRYHDLDHATGEIPKGIQSRGAVQEGGEAVAVYQSLAGAAVVGWDLSEMDQKIEAEERRAMSSLPRRSVGMSEGGIVDGS